MNEDGFIQVIRKELDLDSSTYAEIAAEAVLRALHDRLTEGQAEQIETHLPKELKPLWSRSLTEKLLRMWRGPEKMTKREFLDRIQNRAHLRSRAETEYVAHGVFKVLKRQLPLKQVENVGTHLPKDLESFWNAS